MEGRPPIWKVAANILNKQSRIAGKGWSSILGVGRGANNCSPLKRVLLRNIHRESPGTGLTDTLTVHPVATKEAVTTEPQRYQYITRNGGNVIPANKPVQRLKVAIVPLDLTTHWTHNLFKEILTTGKNQNMKTKGLFTFSNSQKRTAEKGQTANSTQYANSTCHFF